MTPRIVLIIGRGVTPSSNVFLSERFFNEKHRSGEVFFQTRRPLALMIRRSPGSMKIEGKRPIPLEEPIPSSDEVIWKDSW